MRVGFKPEQAAGEILTSWWEGLNKDAGGRARIRRCKNPQEVMLEPAFHRLLKRMAVSTHDDGTFEQPRSFERLAAVAGLVAHVKTNESRTLADHLADDKGGRPLYSALRFRRLMQEPFEDLYQPMIRVIRQLDHTANVSDLAVSIFYWGDEVRKRWALAYFPKVVE